MPNQNSSGWTDGATVGANAFRVINGIKKKQRWRPGIDPEPFVCRDQPDVTPLNKTLMELQEGECRYVYGDDPASMVFCGHPIHWRVDGIVSKIRTSRKRLVAHGFKPKVIDFALRLRKDEDDEMIEQRRAEIEVARFLNHPIGTQPELPLNMEDRTPLVDKASAEGEVAGAAGQPCQAPYSGEAEQAWIKGWQQGQATLASAFRKLEAKAAADGEAAGDDAEGED